MHILQSYLICTCKEQVCRVRMKICWLVKSRELIPRNETNNKQTWIPLLDKTLIINCTLKGRLLQIHEILPQTRKRLTASYSCLPVDIRCLHCSGNGFNEEEMKTWFTQEQSRTRAERIESLLWLSMSMMKCAAMRPFLLFSLVRVKEKFAELSTKVGIGLQVRLSVWREK
jgi:hypothetical protein